MIDDTKSSERENQRSGANSGSGSDSGSRSNQRRKRSGDGSSSSSQRAERPSQRQYSRATNKTRVPRTRKIIVLINKNATYYRESDIKKFISGAESNGFTVETITPTSPQEMVNAAAETRKHKPHILVAAGGDGSVNLVARTLIGSPGRLGILPLGRFNNIFTSLIGKPSVSLAIKALSGGYRSIDCGKVSEQPFFNSIGLGLAPALAETLESRFTPNFAISWSRLAARAASQISRSSMPVRVDSYRFDLEPALIGVNLLPKNFGLAFAPSALPDDRRFEVTLDMSTDGEPLSKFVRSVYKGSCYFDEDIRMYRGEEIIIGGVKGQKLYLDGELIDVPTNTLEIKFYSKQLRVSIPDSTSGSTKT